MRRVAVCLLLAGLAACRATPPTPAALDTRNDACGMCRMLVSDARFAGQIVAPGELPVFFDDIGCLAQYLREHAALPDGAVAFVADHSTKDWTRASTAVFTKLASIETPMGSHVIAHASTSSRDADPDARGGVDMPRASVSERFAQADSR